MNCKKCGFQLVDGQDICPRCGASQSGIDEASQGVSMELPTAGAVESVSAEPKAKKEKAPAKEAVKETAEKAKKKAKETAEKVKDKAKEAAAEVEEATEKVKGGSSKTWLYIVIGAAAAVILIIAAYFVISYAPKGDDELNSVLLAYNEDTIFIVNGDTLEELAELPEDLYASEVIIAADENSFYYIADAEYDEDAGEYIGDLLYLKSNGKEEDIDSDVIVGTQELVGDVLWYEKADKEDVIVCCYDGKEAMEVIEEEELTSWIGTDTAGKAYYTLTDEEDYTTEVFIVDDGDSESIMDEAQIVATSDDYKKLLLVTYDEEEITVHIYDGKDDFEVMDDVQDILLDTTTFDMFVIADADDMVLYYIPYGKEEVELDDEVEEIVSVDYVYYSVYVTDDLGDYAYYDKEGDLYMADLKGKDSDKILKDYQEIEIIALDNDAKTVTYVDDDEIVIFNYETLKEESVELPDADELTSSDVVIIGDWYVYRTEENKEIFAYNGKKDAVELSDDADEIYSFSEFMDTYVLWENADEELILSEMKEDSAEVIGEEVYSYWTTDDGEVYFLSDYDYESGEGELYYLSKVGKDAERIEKDIASLLRLYYE